MKPGNLFSSAKSGGGSRKISMIFMLRFASIFYVFWEVL
jgi:hypothetical protein